MFKKIGGSHPDFFYDLAAKTAQKKECYSIINKLQNGIYFQQALRKYGN